MKKTLLTLALTAATALVGAPASATVYDPWNGCATAEPKTSRAADCRDDGWTILPRVAIDPGNVVRRVEVRRCARPAPAVTGDTDCYKRRAGDHPDEVRLLRWSGYRVVFYVDAIPAAAVR